MEGGCDAGADGSRVPAKISRGTRRSGAKIAQDLYDSGNGRRLPPSPFRLSLYHTYLPLPCVVGIGWLGVDADPHATLLPHWHPRHSPSFFSSLRVLFVDFVVQLTSGIYYLFWARKRENFGCWTMATNNDLLHYRVSWWVWAKKTRTSVMRLNPNVVFWLWNTRLSTVSSPTGMIWRKSGTTPSTTSCAWLPRNTPFSWLRLPSTPRLTVRKWPRCA